MIQLPRNKVAVIPVFDSDETKGGIIKPSSFEYKREVLRYDVYGSLNWDHEPKKLDECGSKERLYELMDRYKSRGYLHVHYKTQKETVDQETLDSGERCDQGVVKYLGADVTSVKIGDYVFFSGYTGTLMEIEGEGKLIILPEKFVEVIFDIDKFHTVPGLYFKGRDNTYFPATYEQAMSIMADSFSSLGLTVDVTPSKPKVEDYDERQ